MKSSLKSWAVKRQSTLQRVVPTLDEQKDAATSAGLPWPQPHKRQIGRPSRADLWQNALYKAIATGDFHQLGGGKGSRFIP
eukprot:3399458-Amphidinium_carterae.1